MALHPVLDATFDELLRRWRHHDDLRRARADVRLLAASRHRLDEMRSEMARLRQALHPEPADLGEVVFAAHCDTLETPVFFRRLDGRPGPGGPVFSCICGELVG